ncbi:MAG: glycosyltransferase, partial [Lachnospiraceae bacterium]|nr:glycosyltransferase [Lachnospiraceae bacterium]
MRHHIEHAKYQYDRITVTGWLAGDNATAQTQVWAEDARGRRIPCQVERTLREDVAGVLFGAEAERAAGNAVKADEGSFADYRYGFRLLFDAVEGQPYVLCLSDGRRTVRCKTDAAQIRKLGRIPDDWKERVKIKLGKGEPAMMPLRKANRQRDREAGRYLDVSDPANQTVKFSCVIPAYNTEPEHLADMIESIRQQTYPNWEICIADGSPRSMWERFRKVSVGEADPEMWAAPAEANAVLPSLTVKLARTLVEYLTDPRVKYEHLSENLGISGNTNAALALAEGQFVVMVDHDDVLEDDALEMVADVVRKHPQADFIYTDSDLTDHDHLYNYNHLCKPRWSQEMLYSANYITHLSVVRTELLRQIGGWKKEYDGAQDWDLFLRIGERTGEIYHIPEVLYHWRAAA